MRYATMAAASLIMLSPSRMITRRRGSGSRRRDVEATRHQRQGGDPYQQREHGLEVVHVVWGLPKLPSGVALTTFLFDLDGTLIDSIELILRSYRHTLRTHRGEEPADDVWMEGLGTPLWVQFRRFSEDPAEIEAMVATYRTYNLAHHDEMVRPYDGVVEAVRGLEQRGRPLGAGTGKLRAGASRGLGRAALEDAFDVVVGADDVTHPKPHPEPVQVALERLGGRASETVFVGDSRHDLVAGRAAGVKTAAALWGPFDRFHLADLEPDYWLETPRDLSLLASDD